MKYIWQGIIIMVTGMICFSLSVTYLEGPALLRLGVLGFALTILGLFYIVKYMRIKV